MLVEGNHPQSECVEERYPPRSHSGRCSNQRHRECHCVFLFYPGRVIDVLQWECTDLSPTSIYFEAQAFDLWLTVERGLRTNDELANKKTMFTFQLPSQPHFKSVSVKRREATNCFLRTIISITTPPHSYDSINVV